MKIVHYIGGFLIFAGVFISSCTKDGGYYEPEVIERNFHGNAYEYLKSKPGVYDSLVKVIDRLGMQSIVQDSNITLFALTNQSFQLAITNLNNLRRLADRPNEYLESIKYEHLDTMVTQYIMRGKYVSDSLQKQDGLRLLGVRYGYPMQARLAKTTSSGYVDGGPEIITFSDTKRSQFERDWVVTSTSSINIETDNAIVHVVDQDHVFGFDDFVSRLTFIPPPPNLFQIIGGTASVSRENSGGPNAIEASQFAFDGNPETKFLLGGFSSEWLQFELNEATVADSYTITSANDFPDRDPIDWNLQASHDGENWVTLDSRSAEIFDQRFQQKIFHISNNVAYKFYRLNITRSRGGSTMQMADWSVNNTTMEDAQASLTINE